MAFQTPITIADAINRIDTNQFLLPAIQREFVWSSDQIEWLFDSVMRGYPISSFLLWEVQEKTAKEYRFYKFINEYREKYKIHNDEISTAGMHSFNAILDGQQRLTSLYIGLKGSYAYKEYKRKWENTEHSIPTRHLYLNISNALEDEEDGRIYEFLFLNKSDTKEADIYLEEFEDGTSTSWFKVGAILNYKDEQEFDEFVENIDNKFSRLTIKQLRRSILEKPVINYFLESEQDLDKALNIFIRINSGGLALDFSDLIMSIAVANWKEKDARKEIHQLVDAIRDKDFSISKDFILKTFLYLYSPDIKFKVTNFSKENAKDFEVHWEKIRDAILATFDLIKTFGFNDYTLTSKNALIPIVYYLYHRNIYRDFSTKTQFKKDRAIINKWLHTVLIKRAFGGTSDSVLSQIRRTFTENVVKKPLKNDIVSFPTEFKYITKDLSVGEEFIEDLLGTPMENQYAFSILSLLYPNLDYKNNNFHKDHLHPEFQYDDLNDEDKDNLGWEVYNSIYNLQMLDANENMSKNNKTLKEWVKSQTKLSTKADFLNNHLIPDVDLDISNFEEFYEKRKTLLIDKMSKILN